MGRLMSSTEVNAMPLGEWRNSMKSIVRGVTRQLCASAPRHVIKRLEDLEARQKGVKKGVSPIIYKFASLGCLLRRK